MTRFSTLSGLLAVILAAGCAPQASDEGGVAVAPRGAPSSILVRSSPVNGASLSRSPANLALVFSRPVRLHEVIVSGSDGSAMPMMVSSAGETTSYSLPLPDLEPGSYTVTWRAGAGGQDSTGTIRFKIR